MSQEPARGPQGSRSTDRLPTPRTAGEMLRMARGFLERKGCEEARLEAELLVASALGIDRLGLFMALERPLSGAEVDAGRDLLVRRGRREPVAYVIGEREFYGRPFHVGPGVLIPRPETELLVDRARALLGVSGPPEMRAASASTDARRILDVGTGSGCLAITLALEIAGSEVFAVDLSPAANEYARANARALGATIHLVEGDGPEAAGSLGPFDLVLSNPPYVDPQTSSELAAEVRDYEPPEALFAPEGDPDHWVRRLLGATDRMLVPGGTLLVELGVGQGPRALELARARGLAAVLHPDLAGIERVLEVTDAR